MVVDEEEDARLLGGLEAQAKADMVEERPKLAMTGWSLIWSLAAPWSRRWAPQI